MTSKSSAKNLLMHQRTWLWSSENLRTDDTKGSWHWVCWSLGGSFVSMSNLLCIRGCLLSIVSFRWKVNSLFIDTVHLYFGLDLSPKRALLEFMFFPFQHTVQQQHLIQARRVRRISVLVRTIDADHNRTTCAELWLGIFVAARKTSWHYLFNIDVFLMWQKDTQQYFEYMQYLFFLHKDASTIPEQSPLTQHCDPYLKNPQRRH